MPASSVSHPLNAYLQRIHRQFGSIASGKVADYIPELGKANPDNFGIVLVTTDGEVYGAGDVDVEFTIQSISKAFVYATALADKGQECVLKKVYVEPTGDAFNSISLDPKTGAPLNPMINAGAIATAGLVGGATTGDQWQRIIDSLSAFAGRKLRIDDDVYRSESETGFRNRAIGWMLRNFGIIEQDPIPVVENYFRQCSVLVNCKDLGIMGACLANGGINPLTGERVLPVHLVGPTLSVMSTCGMYDYAGSWMFEVGLPAKSGVGGGIVAVLPGRFAVATYSPPLDSKGNSVRGIAAFKALSNDLGLHLMGGPRLASQVISREYSGMDVSSNRMRNSHERDILKRRGRHIRVLSLQGDVALDGAERISRRLVGDCSITHAVLDMHRVSLLSLPAARVIIGSAHQLKSRGGELCFARVHAEMMIEETLREASDGKRPEFNLFPDTDRAMEWCEDRILGEEGGVHQIARVSLTEFEMLSGLTGEELGQLELLMRASIHEAGTAIVSAGEHDDDRIFLLLEGEVSVLVESFHSHTQRLATLGPGMTFGEMVLLGQSARTASVHADSPVTCRVLRASDLNRLAETQPRIKMILLSNLATLLAGKLRESNRLISALAQ